MKPVIALVGRPNVGKSTLFNRLTKSRDAIVADFAGLTRDRHYGNGKQGKHEYIVIDTGGFEPDASSGIYREMAKQTQQAVAEADVVVFVVDARAGLSAQDHDIANYLRRLSKPCVLVANKAEGMVQGVQLAEFYELGLGEVYPVSAAHGQGIRGLVDLALAPLQLPDPDEADGCLYANLSAPIRLITALLPRLRARPEAAIVNVTSGLAIAPNTASSVYCASKAGLRSYTMALRAQLAGEPMLVVEALPPVVDTQMTADRDMSKMPPQECARQIIAALEGGRAEANVGMVKLLRAVYSLSPALARRVMRSF